MAEEQKTGTHYDWLIKLNQQRFGRELAAWLFQETPLEVRPLDTALPALRIGYADKLLEVQFGSRQPVLLHVEWQKEGRATIPGRMSDYLSLVLALLRSEEHAGKALALVVIYFDELGLRVFVAYRVIKLWEMDPETVLKMESPGLCPFVPLMRGNPVDLLLKSKEKILQSADDLANFELKKELLAVLAGLATRVVADREVLDQVVSEIEAMGENYVFDRFFNRGREAGLQEGRQEGREAGALCEAREAVLRIIRRRFGAPAEDVSRRLDLISSRSRLEALIEEAAVAPSLEEFLNLMP